MWNSFLEARIKSDKRELVGRISDESGVKGRVSVNSRIIGSIGVGAPVDNTTTYVLIDSEGNEIPAVLVDEEVYFTATENDIREGMVAATDSGVTIGTKEIPAYHTTEGGVVILPGTVFSISIPRRKRYEYTKLQAIICPFNTSMSTSVAAEKVCIEDGVYDVNSTVKLSSVTLDHEKQSINLGITNESDAIRILRYFTYKEEE